MRWRFLLLVFGLSLIVVGGVQEIALWRVASRTPTERTCRELATDGPGANAHLLLRDFVLCENAFVYEERNGRWTVAWVPAVPRGVPLDADGRPRGQDIGVIVKMPRARSFADVHYAAQCWQLQGMVTNAIEQLGREEVERLRHSYPDVDFARCQIFELDRSPAGWMPVAGSLLGGTLLILYMLWTLLAGQGTVAHGPLPPELQRTPGRTGRSALPSQPPDWSNPERP